MKSRKPYTGYVEKTLNFALFESQGAAPYKGKKNVPVKVFVPARGKTLKDIKALLLQDGAGIELDIKTDEDNIWVIKVGDVATVEGKPASGKFVLPNGTVLTFEKGILKKIVTPEGENAKELSLL